MLSVYMRCHLVWYAVGVVCVCDMYASKNMVADCLTHRRIWWNENSKLSMEMLIWVGHGGTVLGVFTFVYSIAWLKV